MNSKQVREKFLEFFEKNGHTRVASSSLIPAEDPTLLFANAGMNQFKDLFLGKEIRSYNKATSSQKCVRAGGKHNDLENVGFTARHLTFFEMLGNFSFGDYFKKEAISFAWELLTKGYQLPADKLYVSIFQDDDEAFEIWHKIIGLPANRIARFGHKDNFWQMGDTGPCGPCTEIHVYTGSETDPAHIHWGPGAPDGLFFEIWNLVFMQFNRSADGTLTPLKQTGVDTGMGLERLTMVLQGKDTVFKTDLFDAIRFAIEQRTSIQYLSADIQTQAAFNVVCDHIRSSCLLIADGCSPANDGRGYVLRKIIRRGILFAQKLADPSTLMTESATAFINDMSSIYPELLAKKELILSILAQEVERFIANLHNGQKIFEKYAAQTKAAGSKTLSGEHAFKLYDTYGFPLELTKVLAYDQELLIDEVAFTKCMQEQQEQSRKTDLSLTDAIDFPENLSTTFTGYTSLTEASRIAWVHKADTHLWIITDKSPFYVESGGQVNDTGTVTINEHSYSVVDLKKVGLHGSPAIAVKLEPFEDMGPCKKDDIAHCSVDANLRNNTVRNHTATHMLHAALHEILGAHANQAGSVVNADYLRFDYTHHESLSEEVVRRIEQRVNEKIWQDIRLEVHNTTLKEAQSKGVIAFFGEKYNPESVRVVTIPGFSAELCGGTHASSTGIIGCFKITQETSLATGTRRIVAVTGQKALELFQRIYADAKEIAEQFKTKPEGILSAVTKQTEQLEATLREVKQLSKELLRYKMSEFLNCVKTVGNWGYAVINEPRYDIGTLRELTQYLQDKKPGIYAAITQNEGAVQFVVTTHQAALGTFAHPALTNLLSEQGLRGGGKPGTIQGGGPLSPEAVAVTLEKWIVTQT